MASELDAAAPRDDLARPAITAYLAAAGLRDELREELEFGLREAPHADDSTRELSWHGELALLRGAPLPSAWAAEVFPDAELLPIASIGDAARQLRARGRNWVHVSLEQHRRGELIAEKLPPLRARPLRFGDAVPAAPLGHFGLLASDTLLVMPRGRTRVPRGELLLQEDHEGPPSRAYLKLQEAFTRLGRAPAPGELCVDLGASPGGWTWVLLELGARVVAIDKAPLAPELEAHPDLTTVIGSAFAPLPEAAAGARWIVSDVICYPERLLRLLDSLLAQTPAPNLVATIKFQGRADPAIVAAFRGLPRARVEHLQHNKHELCFTSLAPD